LCSRAMSVGAALVSRFHATPSSHTPRAHGDIRWAVPEGRVPRGSHRRVPWLDTLFAMCTAMQQRRTRTGSCIVGSCCRSRDLPGASSRVESSRIERDTHAHTGLRRIQASSPSAHRAVAASHDRTYSCSMTLTGRALAPPHNRTVWSIGTARWLRPKRHAS